MSIAAETERMKDEIVGLTKELVSIPTINPPGSNYEKMVDALEKKCKSLGLKTTRHTVPKHLLVQHGIDPKYPRINLVADWDVGAKKTLHINGHYDVVPVTGSWKTDPFKPLVKAGKLYGRGSYDMKCNIAATLSAIKVLKKLGFKPKANIQLSFVCDEETGGRLGFRYLVDNNLVRADYAVSEGLEGNKVSNGNKGMVTMMVEVIGKSGHAAYSYKAVNAFEHASMLVQDILRLKKQVERRRTRHDLGDERQKHPTLVMGGILEGGNKSNTVPDKVVFSIDRRVLPEETMAIAKKEIIDVARAFERKHAGIRVRIKAVQEDKPIVVEKGSYLCRVFSSCIKKVYGKDAEYRLMSGATDLRFLLYKGIPGLGYGAKGKNLHSDDEFVYIKSLVDTTKVMAELMSAIE